MELIPDSVPEPQTDSTTLARSLQNLWRSLHNRLAQELPYEQKLEYLERCLMVAKDELNTGRNTLAKL